MRALAGELPKEVLDMYVYIRTLDDGRICGVHQLLFHWTVHVDIHEIGYEDRWCFTHSSEAIEGLNAWSGEGDMAGRWRKHPASGRRRNPDTGEIWHESEYRGG